MCADASSTLVGVVDGFENTLREKKGVQIFPNARGRLQILPAVFPNAPATVP